MAAVKHTYTIHMKDESIIKVAGTDIDLYQGVTIHMEVGRGANREKTSVFASTDGVSYVVDEEYIVKEDAVG